jgi:hypothetical protein
MGGAGVNRNELFPSQSNTDNYNSRSNFTHYEEKLLATHSKSKKSIDATGGNSKNNKNSNLPS